MTGPEDEGFDETDELEAGDLVAVTAGDEEVEAMVLAVVELDEVVYAVLTSADPPDDEDAEVEIAVARVSADVPPRLVEVEDAELAARVWAHCRSLV